MFSRVILPWCIIIYFVSNVSAWAYIDPNTGGFFFQTVAPFVYGMLGVLVVFWKRISGFVKGFFSKKKNLGNADKDS